MTLEIFISILVLSATVTSLGIEIIKNLLNKFNIKYDTLIVATIIAFILGVAEIFIYYGMNGLTVTAITFVYSVCMGIANLVASQVGYDKIKEFILVLFTKK